MVRTALVGYGAQFGMGKHHAENINKTEGLQVVGVYDLLPERRDAARAEQPGTTIYESFEDLIADENVDMVVLITPHDTHAPLSIAASRAGKHVVTEKVMCLDAREADEMISAAKTAGKMLTVYQNRRWDGDYLTVKKVIESGALGSVFQIESSVNGWWFPAGWRGVKSHGGGMLYDWGAHLLDQIVQLMLPARPKTVYATNHYRVYDVDVATQTTAIITFDNGVVAEIDVGCISHHTRPRWLIRGDKAAMKMENWDEAYVRGEVGGLYGEMKVELEKSRWDAFYRNVSRHLNFGEPLAVLPEEVRISIAIIEAARKSAETGKSVDLG